MHPETAQLPNLAFDSVLETCYAAEQGRHTPGSWPAEGMTHHWRHANTHLANIDAGRVEKAKLRQEIEHLITRATMMLWSLDHEIYGDNGAEGKGL